MGRYKKGAIEKSQEVLECGDVAPAVPKISYNVTREYVVDILIEPKDKYDTHQRATGRFVGVHPFDVTRSIMKKLPEDQKYRDYIFRHKDFLDNKGEEYIVVIRAEEGMPLTMFEVIGEDE